MSDIALTPCGTCEKVCCGRVPVTIPDIARIWHRLRIPLADFLCISSNEDPKSAPYTFQVQGWPCSLVMRGPEGDSTGCSFVMRIGSRDRCGIYDFRPAVCRVFPFKRVEGVVAPDLSVSSCAERFSIAPDDAHFHQAFDEYEEDLRVQAELCQEWNTTPPRYPSNLALLLEFVQEILDSGRV